MKIKTICILSLAAGLAACASSDKEPRVKGVAAFADDPRLGQEVRSACYGREIDGFRDTRRDSVIIKGNGRREYLVTTSSCFQLEDALRLGVDSRGGCLSRGDKLVVSENFISSHRGNSLEFDTCFVTGIYDWNEKAAEPAESEENEK